MLVLWWYRRYMRMKYGTKSVDQRNILPWFRMLRIWPNSADSSATAVVGSGGSTWMIDDFESAMMHQVRLSPDSDEDPNFHFDALSPAHSFPFSDRASAPQLLNPAHANGQHVRPLGKARKDSGSPTRVPFSTSSSSGSNVPRESHSRRRGAAFGWTRPISA
ncbi:hypothetical protein FIBSPDRAFT_859640, partial [Athelia psychrophila]